MLQFKSKDKFELKGRGTVYCVEFPKLKLKEVRAWTGTEIEIDGTKHRIQGVETFAQPDNCYTTTAGLLV